MNMILRLNVIECSLPQTRAERFMGDKQSGSLADLVEQVRNRKIMN